MNKLIFILSLIFCAAMGTAMGWLFWHAPGAIYFIVIGVVVIVAWWQERKQAKLERTDNHIDNVLLWRNKL